MGCCQSSKSPVDSKNRSKAYEDKPTSGKGGWKPFQSNGNKKSFDAKKNSKAFQGRKESKDKKEEKKLKEDIQEKSFEEEQKKSNNTKGKNNNASSNQDGQIVHANSFEKKSTDKSMANNIKIDPSKFIQERKGDVSQQYQTIKLLGEGAYGQVFKVKLKNTHEIRAMKVIKKGSVKNIANITNEIEILKKLDHPHIIKIYEFYQDPENFYIITDFCGGGELFDRIIKTKKLTESYAASIMRQLLSAVSYCHKRKIVHRDLKPENLLLESEEDDSKIKVIDFGTSYLFKKAQVLEEKFGTPYYIAPEVLKKQYDEKCDIWSCGVILYILLCGYPPFAGANDDEILKKVETGVYSFKKNWEGVSQDAKDLIRQLLTYNSRERLTAEEALKSKWIIEMNSIDSKRKEEPILNALKNISNFRCSQKLQQAVAAYMASHLQNVEKKNQLRDIFTEFDKNGDGELDREELILGYEKMLGNKEKAIQEVDEVLEKIDINKNGTIDFTEFIMTNLEKDDVVSEEKLMSAFKLFDVDGNGSINVNEICSVLFGTTITEENKKGVEQIINEIDEDKNGEISFKEFKTMMVKMFKSPK